jgi:CII-binding regulator of phage lambda lysogenization HflD
MTDRQLRQTLQTLHEEIDSTVDIDDTSRQRLERLMVSIERKLVEPQDAIHHRQLVELLREEIAYFEISHPILVTALNDILTMLSAGGL